MGIDLLLIFKWYVLIGVAFVITSLFTLHFPSWRIAKEWAVENLPERIPTSGHIFGHTISYIVVSFLLYPAVAAAVLASNKDAVIGYSKSLIKSLIEEDQEDDE